MVGQNLTSGDRTGERVEACLQNEITKTNFRVI